jgi:hypothetical protein
MCTLVQSAPMGQLRYQNSYIRNSGTTVISIPSNAPVPSGIIRCREIASWQYRILAPSKHNDVKLPSQ